MRAATILLAAVATTAAVLASGLSPEDFKNPPPSARPHTWWHWMNGNVTKDGITADLEAMARAGIGGAQIFDAGLSLPQGPVKFASEEWFDCLVHADREARRLGIELCIANCSGWTSSAGPWITPELSMKYVASTAVEVKGGTNFHGALPLPDDTKGFYEDIAVLAVPAKKPVLLDIPDFDIQVSRTRGSDQFGTAERGPQLPEPITDEMAKRSDCIATEDIIDLTASLHHDGSITWHAPSSHSSWRILRIGYMCNGRTNRSASRSGLGLECDKLDPHALDVHFDAYVGRLLSYLGPNRALKGVLLDSYEVFGQNWTRGFDKVFAAKTGYSITNYLPVLAGHPVGSAAETDRFLRDFRLVISSLFSKNYAGRLRERCRENGLLLYCEPYGNGPFNDLEFARECDVPMSEFWRPRNYNCDLAALSREKDPAYMQCRWGNKPLGNSKTIASTAHVWGRRIVGSEAFTSYPDEASGRWLDSPFGMKLQCDRVFTEGVNRMIFHRFVHQPWTNPTIYPGMTMAAYGAHIDRTQTWWEHGAAEFFTYMTRAQHLLQQGTFVGDVLLVTSGEAPDYGTDGEIPKGYDGDRCHPAVLDELNVLNCGDVVAPGGTRYRVVGTPPRKTLRANVNASLAKLEKAGATVVEYGEVATALKRCGCEPDLLLGSNDATWIHRSAEEDDLYFIAVPNKTACKVDCSFRIADRTPELWDPVTGETSTAPATVSGGRTSITLSCNPLHSVFVVFRARHSANQAADTAVKAKATIPISGPWRVSFREPGAKVDIASADFEELASWTTCADDNIRYFSGTATYRKDAELKTLNAKLAEGERAVLDLGDVKDIAEVKVNGKVYPALWCPPYAVDITDAIGSGATLRLEIKTTNRWPNRLIGDARLAEDCEWDDGSRSKGFPLVRSWPEWLLRGERSPTGRHTFSTCRFWEPDAPLLDSGLIGPVTLKILEKPSK